MGNPDHLTCLLRNMYAGQKATVRMGPWTTDWFQTGKGVCQACILSSCLFNFYAEYIMQNVCIASWNQDCLLEKISKTLNMQMTPPLWQKEKSN